MAQVLVNEDARRVVDGVEYHAVTATNACKTRDGRQCAMLVYPPAVCDAAEPACHPGRRIDRSHVIWVKAQ